MNRITPEEIERYCEAHSSLPTEALLEIEQATRRSLQGASMESGALQGRLLAMISHMIRPSLIIEIGTFTGYSALCLAEGLAPGGKLITIEKELKLEPVIRENLSRSAFGRAVELHMGDAHELLPRITDIPDLMFIDADKRGYDDYYSVALEKVKPGGFLLFDNVLWKGHVLDPAPDARTRAIMEFNDRVAADVRVEKVMLPVRDGLLLVKKKLS